MSRYPRRPPIVKFKPSHARFASAPQTPQYTAEVWKQLVRYAPDQVAALIDAAHEEAHRLNQEESH